MLTFLVLLFLVIASKQRDVDKVNVGCAPIFITCFFDAVSFVIFGLMITGQLYNVVLLILGKVG